LEDKECTLTPDVEFLQLFAAVLGPKWPSLAVLLLISESEIEEIKRAKKVSQEEQALRMLKKWALKEDATCGSLCQKLQHFSLFDSLSQP